MFIVGCCSAVQEKYSMEKTLNFFSFFVNGFIEGRSIKQYKNHTLSIPITLVSLGDIENQTFCTVQKPVKLGIRNVLVSPLKSLKNVDGRFLHWVIPKVFAKRFSKKDVKS